VWLHSFFTGQSRELSEAFASVLAMGMLLYVNFETFNKSHLLPTMSIAALGFMAFISVFRELAEVILFYYTLFEGSLLQQLGTLSGLLLGIVLLGVLLWLYKSSTARWKIVNRVIFNLTPIFIFILAIMCVGNAINAFQEARWLQFTPINGLFNNNFLHAQASEQYAIGLLFFFASTGLLFFKQFYKSFVLLLNYFVNSKKTANTVVSGKN
jgi:high-affinity Fe2+/Pb2+ permease